MNGSRLSFLAPLAALLLLPAPAVRPLAAAERAEVVVQRPVQRAVTDYETFAGRTEAVESVELRARVSGYLLKVAFKEGARVKKGDLLFEIDPRVYQAALLKAEAEIAAAEARAKLADAEYQRAQQLAKTAKGTITPGDLDRYASRRAEARAGVAVARAGIDQARLDLDFTRVRAPIDGRIGRALLTPGNLVRADTTVLARIVSEDPMYVYFDMDERSLLRYRRLVSDKKVKEDAVPLALGLASDGDYPHKAKLDFVSNTVNPTTGCVRVRGVLANPRRLFVPGMYVKVRMPFGGPHQALLVPAKAIRAREVSKHVLVLDDKNRVVEHLVVVGQEIDGRRVIEAGLKPGDRVVVGGPRGLKAGDEVKSFRLVEGKAEERR